MKEQLKAPDVQGTNSDGKETRTQINALEQKEEETFNQKRMKKQEFKKKKKKRLRNLRDNYKHSNI